MDDAAVIVSELLSNALRHARPLPSGEVRVAWNRDGDVVEVAVSDGGSTTEPRRTRPTLSSLGGRGLGIVDTLADCWGVRRDNGTTTVWALVRGARAGGRAGHTAVGAQRADGAGHPTANVLRGTRPTSW